MSENPDSGVTPVPLSPSQRDAILAAFAGFDGGEN